MNLLKKLNILTLIFVTLFFFSCSMPGTQEKNFSAENGEASLLIKNGAISKAVVTGGPVSLHGDLQILNKGGEYGYTICDENGNPYQLKGFSMLDLNQWDTAWVPGATIPNIISLTGSNAVRLAMYTSEGSHGYMDQDYNGKMEYRAKMKELIRDAINHDVYVMVDWHILNDGGYDMRPWEQQYWNEARAFFEDIASTFPNEDNLIFELCNEPKGVSYNDQIKPYAEHVLAGIRKYSDNLVVVGTPRWSQDVDHVVNNQITNNVGRGILYSLHFYAATHYGGLRGKGDTALNNNVPVMLSEWGTVDASGNGTIDLNSSTEWLDWADRRNISWFNWSLSIRNESSAALYGDKNLAGPWTESDFTISGKYILSKLPGKNVDKTHPVPGMIEAEEYSSSNNVQKEPCDEGGQNVGYIVPGSSMTYKINVTSGGTYKAEYRVAGKGKIAFNLTSGGVTLDTQNSSATGDWQVWKSISTASGAEFSLSPGETTFTITSTGQDWNINKFELIKVGGEDYTLTVLPAGQTTGSGTYPAGTVVNISYTGSDFTGWSGAVANPNSPNTTVTVNGNMTVTAMTGENEVVIVEAESYFDQYGIQTELCRQGPAGNRNVGWTDPEDWMDYSVNVNGGTYTVSYDVAAWTTTASLQLLVGGQVKDSLNITKTGDGYQDWSVQTGGQITLSGGNHTIRIKSTGDGFNIDKFTLTGGSNPTDYTLTVLPSGQTTGSGTYPAGTVVNISYTGANFKNWTGGTVANPDSSSTTVTMTGNITVTANTGSTGFPIKIEAEDFTNMNGIKLEECGEDNTQNIGYIDGGDWVDYQVNLPVSSTGYYKVTYRAASLENGGQIQFEAGSVRKLLSVGSTGGWQSYQDKVIDGLGLNAGSQTIRLYAPSGPWNLNYFTIEEGRQGHEGDWPTSSQMVTRMGKGINMGNTLEAPTEGAWAKAAEEYFFEDYKNAGYTNVRIPIKWGNHIDWNGNIDAGFMDRAEQVVDWALSKDLIVIINAHHENWVIDDYWNNIGKLEHVWTQIASRFADKSPNLVFEILNEPRNNPGSGGTMGTGECNDMNNRILPIIRNQNPKRIVIIGGSGWGNYVDMMKIDVPGDTTYLMAQFHYYNPIEFTHNKQAYEQRYWGGNQSDWDTVWGQIGEAAAWAAGKNIPLFCGEFGVMHSNPEDNYSYWRDWGSAMDWYTCTTEALNHHNIAFSVWDDAGWFGVYDRNARTFNEAHTRIMTAKQSAN